MPRLNLKDEGLDADGAPETSKSPSPTPSLREVGAGGGRVSPIILIALIIVVLAGGVYALNHFKVIRLWGKKAPVVTETLPEPEIPVATQAQEPAAGGTGAAGTEPVQGAGSDTKAPTTATKEPSTYKPAATSAPAGSGRYTVQFAAWMSRGKAEQEASLLSAGGYDAYVDEARAGSDHWFRVRIGRFDSRTQAQETVAKLQPMTEDVVWVAKMREK
jgi:cell division septation protein DedD